MQPLPFRQVHLDFHTNGSIPGVGAKFDKKAFQAVLQEARVNSITCFSKCHHGWSYHDTKVGKRHPHMKGELLAKQIEACREIGVRVPIYLSAGLDELALSEHPEWRTINQKGVGVEPFHAGWRGLLRWNSPYLDYLCRQIEEVVTRWRDADGIFLDIIGPRLDYSDDSLAAMKARGYNPENEAEVAAWAHEVLLENYYKKTTAAARSHNADMPVFHNCGHVHIGASEELHYNSHLELESLPTGGWGYDHFPLSVRYAITTGHDFLGMTGKFHTSWGEFGGFKRPEALRYECEAMIAYGAKCGIGDQLHPSGEINRDTYALIGEAYRTVEAKEAWCSDVKPVARIGLVSAAKPDVRQTLADEGASRMLLELHQPFLVLDAKAPWTPFDLVILPDSIVFTDELQKKARRYLAQGGRILASGTSLLDETGQAIALPEAGIRYVGRSASDPDYLVATALSAADVPVKSPVVIHGGALEVEPLAKTRVLAERATPYFNRTWEHFCSHQHAPDEPGSEAKNSPAATLSAEGNVAYFAHDIFTRYRLYGQPLYRDFVLAAIKVLLSGGGGDGNALPVVTANLPSTGRVNVMEQRAHRRFVVHVLHAVPTLRGGAKHEGPHAWPVEVIEDVTPVSDVRCAVRLPRKVKSARLVPDGAALAFTQRDGVVTFTIPRVLGHQMVELAW
ncbi:MAG: alpha-amylase [Opitutaceae bacterium]|jgi:hypothetical protein|nr:alpha-amylase [Opitutaceae bacterium]